MDFAEQFGRNLTALRREAVIELITLGLLENHGTAVRPTKAAAHMERLRLP
jgi:hypothetical protein